MDRPMNIGEAAAAAGLSAKMIRHYEQLGLLTAAARSEAGYRRYGEAELAVLRFIAQSRRLGFSLPQIGDLLQLWHDEHRASREVKALAQRHLDELAQRMREMAAMQQALQALVARCAGDDEASCAILDQLAAPLPGGSCHGAAATLSPAAAPAARKRSRAARSRASAPRRPAA